MAIVPSCTQTRPKRNRLDRCCKMQITVSFILVVTPGERICWDLATCSSVLIANYMSAPDARANDPDARADERSDQTADHCYCTVLCMRLVAWRLAALVGHL